MTISLQGIECESGAVLGGVVRTTYSPLHHSAAYDYSSATATLHGITVCLRASEDEYQWVREARYFALRIAQMRAASEQ